MQLTWLSYLSLLLRCGYAAYYCQGAQPFDIDNWLTTGLSGRAELASKISSKIPAVFTSAICPSTLDNNALPLMHLGLMIDSVVLRLYDGSATLADKAVNLGNLDQAMQSFAASLVASSRWPEEQSALENLGLKLRQGAMTEICLIAGDRVLQTSSCRPYRDLLLSGGS